VNVKRGKKQKVACLEVFSGFPLKNSRGCENPAGKKSSKLAKYLQYTYASNNLKIKLLNGL